VEPQAVLKGDEYAAELVDAEVGDETCGLQGSVSDLANKSSHLHETICKEGA